MPSFEQATEYTPHFGARALKFYTPVTSQIKGSVLQVLGLLREFLDRAAVQFNIRFSRWCKHFARLSAFNRVHYQVKKISRTSRRASSSSSGICECASRLSTCSPALTRLPWSWTGSDLWPSDPWCWGMSVYGTVCTSVMSKSVSETYVASWASSQSKDSSSKVSVSGFEEALFLLVFTVVSPVWSSTCERRTVAQVLNTATRNNTAFTSTMKNAVRCHSKFLNLYTGHVGILCVNKMF